MKKHLILISFYVFFSLVNAFSAIDTSRYKFHVVPATHYYHGIMGITKDSIGRIWYNGKDVLFMYDGNVFHQMNEYVEELYPHSSLTYKNVFTDKDQRLFVVTNQGLLHFDYAKFRFSMVVEGDINDAIVQDNDGLFWILRNNEIESFYYSAQPQIHKVPFLPQESLSGLSYINGCIYFADGNKIYRLHKGKMTPEFFTSFNGSLRYMKQMIGYENDFFVLMNPGLYRVDGDGNVKKEYKMEGEALSDSKHMYVDEFGVLWVATQNGLLLIDPENEDSTILRSKSDDMCSIPHNSIWSIYPDPDEGVWIGTYGGKLAYLNFWENKIVYKAQVIGQLNNSVVSCFEEDGDGNIWVGTEGGGLNVWNREGDTFSYYTHSDKILNYDLIKSLYFDADKRKLKIAAYNGGVMEYDVRTKRFRDLDVYDPNKYTQQMSVYDFAFDADSVIWTANPEESLCYKNLKTGEVRQIDMVDANGFALDNVAIECLFRDDGDNLWLFSDCGIFVLDVKSQKVEKHYYIENLSSSVNKLICYEWTSKGDLYVGTMGGGINILMRDGSYENVGKSKGFLPQNVFSIEEEPNSGDVWFATDVGVYCYRNKENNYEKVDAFDVDQYGAFYPRSSFVTSKGEIVFGGTKGFFLFDPNEIHLNLQDSKVFFTNLFINDEDIKPTGNSILERDISVMNDAWNDEVIVLNHRQSYVRVHFSSNSYLNSSKNRFAYRLSSHRNVETKVWQELHQGQRFVQFSDLPPGNYTLEVKGANNDGVWGSSISILQFKIKPAPWFSVWAFILYLVFVSAFVSVAYRMYVNRKILQHKLKLERMKEQKMSELNRLRVDFFTNISHDLKTPLTLILSPLSRLKKVVSEDEIAMKYVCLIERNVARIQRMISQLLQFREIESRKVTLNPQPGDLIRYVMDIFSLFVPYAERKLISTSIESYQENLFVDFDHDVLEKILFNLISNAIKYSPEGEMVSLSIMGASDGDVMRLKMPRCSERMECVSIEVLNTGIEINEEQQKKLFRSYARLSDRIPVFESSTGLGLSIVKELVEILGGFVEMESKDLKVVFRVVFPFIKNERVILETKPMNYEYTISELKNIDVSVENIESEKKARKAHDVVVIEDNVDLRGYIKKELSEYYNIYVAANGEDGIRLVQRVNPSVVVTDLKMPQMNGFELSKKLKSDIKTSHIPIVVISALGDNSQHRVQSLKAGADIFIEKPFDLIFLKEQIDSLIKSRNLWREKFSKKFVAEPSRVTFSSADEEFLKKAVAYIEKNIDNSDYNVETFVADMGISRTLLYKKVNEITGMSIKEFILDMRLKRSAQLLADSRLTIAEVAYQTGFNDAGYFSICFKKHYGISPSEFRTSKLD